MILKNEGMKKGIQVRVPQTIDLRYFPKNIVNPDNKSMSFDELYNEFYSHINYPDLVYLDNRLSPVKMIFLSRNAYTLWYIEGTYILHDEKNKSIIFVISFLKIIISYSPVNILLISITKLKFILMVPVILLKLMEPTII